jgi:FkbM family methyltransferase
MPWLPGTLQRLFACCKWRLEIVSSMIKAMRRALGRSIEELKFRVRRPPLDASGRYTLRLEPGVIAFRSNDDIGRRTVIAKTFEPEIRAVLAAVSPPGSTVYDIGANVGIHSIHLAALVGPAGRVVAFEPNAIACDELLLNIELNEITNVTVERLALGSRTGQASFLIPRAGQEAYGGFRETPMTGASSSATVTTMTLDGYVERSGIRPAVCKIDTEGAELEILSGASRLIACDDRPTIVFEAADILTRSYEHTAQDVVQFLTARGYVVRPLCEANFIALPAVAARRIATL